MARSVIVIDMVRGFLEEGHPLYCGDSARRIIPGITPNPRLKRVM